MEIRSFIVYAYCLVNIWAYKVDIQLYEHHNFTGNSTEECTNIYTSLHTEVHSIRTNTCFNAYERAHCKSRWSMKFMPGEINLSQNKFTYIFSFHTCNAEEGYPDVIQRYKNVCSCVNIPKYLQNKKEWSINNHRNEMLVYYEPDCSENKWNSKFIAAGQSYSSKYMHSHKKSENGAKVAYKIQSFGPDPNSPYFRKSCSSSNNLNRSLQTVSRKRTENFGSSIKSVTRHVDDVRGQIQTTTKKVGELLAHIDQSKENRHKFENDSVDILNQHNDNLKMLTEQITELQRNAESSLVSLTLACRTCSCD